MGKITLGEVAIESKATWKSDKVGVPIVGLEHLEPGEITLSNWEINSENTFTKKFLKGQVLLGRRRVYLRKAVIAPVDGICSGDITVIEAIPRKILPELLPFVIQNDKFFDYAVQGSAGSLSPRVKWEHLKKYSFELPSIDEQKVLANKLWAAYSLKESYKKLLSATDEMVKSQFIEMFKDSPKSVIADFCKVEKGATITRNEVIEGDIPVIAGGQEPSCYHNVANRKAGAITISASGAYSGFVNYWSTPIFASDCNTVIPIDEENTNVHFLYNGLKAIQKEIYALQKGGAQPHVYGKDIEKLLFPYPTKAEQDIFADIAQQADKSKFELRKSIEAIDAVIKSLINS